MERKQQGFLRYPLTTLLGKQTSVRVLRELALHGNELTTTMIAKRTGITDQSVRNVVNELLPTDLLQVYGQGRSASYRLDDHHPLAKALITLFRTEEHRFQDIRERIRHAAGDMRPSPLSVWVFGSVARREDQPNSDLDLCPVFGDDDDVEQHATVFRTMIDGVQQEHKITISVIPISTMDVERLAGMGDPFWKEILRDAITWYGKSPEELLRSVEKARKDTPSKKAIRG